MSQAIGSHAANLARALQADHATQVVTGIHELSAEASEAAFAMHALLPESMSMEEFVGIVGNLCLCLGMSDDDMVTFNRALREFTKIMRKQLKDQANG